MRAFSNVVFSKSWSDIGQNISITRKVLKKSVRMHMHDYFEIEIIVGGQGEQTLNGDVYPLKKGTVYFLSPIDFHSVTAINRMELINISFDSSIVSKHLLNTFINHSTNTIFDLPEKDMEQVDLLVSLLMQDSDVNDEYSEMNTKNLFECLLILIIRHMDVHYESSGETEPIYQCMRYLFLHFNETPSLEDMAQMSGYSTSYFSKQFRAITGKKYIDFLTSLKLNYAKLLLFATEKPVIDIFWECGFKSLSNFNHVFKKEIGQSPTQYRQSKRGRKN